MSDKEWEAFYNWCKSQWPIWAPDKISIELYLKWKEDKIKNANFRWKKEVKSEATHS